MHKPKAKFLGLYEADENQIYRALITDCETFGEKSFDITNTERLDYSILTINSPGGESAPFTFEISIRVPRGYNRFSLLYRGKRIAHMNKLKAARLMIERNVAMINPGIDKRYQKWLELNPIDIPVPDHGPLISIVCPLFNTPIPYLREMIDSVLNQTYQSWELVLVNASPNNLELAEVLTTYNDDRIKVIRLERNLGIAGNTNIGIESTSGDYIAFIDHDDIVDKNLLAAYVTRIAEHPDTDLFYCDEDNFCKTLDDAYGPRFKPDFNLDLLYSHNYVLHCLMVSKHALDQIELSPEYVDGAQDYDLTLKVIEVARSIYHAPYVLYHWRQHPGSTNGGDVEAKPYILEAGRRAIEDHFVRRECPLSPNISQIPCVYDIKANGETREPVTCIATYSAPSNIIPLLETLNSSLGHSDKLCFIGPKKPAQDILPKGLEPQTHWITCENGKQLQQLLAALINDASTSRLLFCTEGVRFSDKDCIIQLEAEMQRREIGIAAPKLLYRDGLVEHAGVYIDHTGKLIKLNRYYTNHMGGGYHGLAECTCNYSMVTSDCFIARTKDVKEALEGELPASLDELVEFICLKASQEGRLAVVNPSAVAEILPKRTPKTRYLENVKADKLLSNPNVEVTSGYMRLNIPHNDRAEIIKQYLLALKRRLGFFNPLRPR